MKKILSIFILSILFGAIGAILRIKHLYYTISNILFVFSLILFFISIILFFKDNKK